MRVADTASIASRIELAFQSASTSTGTSFDYLVKTAARESSFNPTAKARTSSATGLFQFIESTWLETMKEAGPKHGLEKYSDQIQRSKSGKFYVSDQQMRREILDLRKDPEISSMMAGALTQKNSQYLERRIGREPSDGELYMAHFLGANGASRLIDAAGASPDMRADKVFSAQARANKPIFYHSNGKARSMQEVYEVIVSKHDAVTMIAQASTNKDLRTSGELTQVATLPNAKPADGAATINQKSFDHLAGDPAAAFAMRTKPAGPGQIARADTTGPQLPQSELFQLAKTDVPLPERTAGQGATTTASAAFLEESVGSVTPDRPVPQTTREAAIDGDDFDASNRVLSAFQATETANPFEALFRNDGASNQAGVNPRFASAFAAVEEAALVSALSGASNQVQAQELALVNQGGPLDLTRFLRLKAEEEQKDLLPPA
ncbi:transglycosylase SLT domain-containing protein [Labrenzia sp. 5N]|uniref:transglycosylase SLT domain-containing protein n=1 Tax=Labrenzia sp. 5N TaxID=2723402 RepID=UPI001447146E|nr:transglycosylase SLT domain-containing protein [Labrenzia sp. 5N]NKX66325.1 transglycosylase SLT domain-containing protein [Labrenzia sp. 5N]